MYSEDDYKGYECGGSQFVRGVVWEYLVDVIRFVIMIYVVVYAGILWFVY